MSTRSFTTPGSHLWLLPANIDVNTPLTVTFKGAGGGGVGGGAGSLLVGTFDISALTPGVDSLEFLVGGKGGTRSGATKGVGGVNGGGAGGNSSSGASGCGGGGWSGLRLGAVLQALAAGGGGQGASSTALGGDGGADTGQAGLDGDTGTRPGSSGGRGGTPSAGGVGGTSYSPVSNDGQDGYALHGGHGNNGALSGMYSGGGGGGGLLGGGGGGGSVNPAFEGGGGGGSDYTSGLVLGSITHTRGGGAAARHNGSVLVAFNAIPDGPAMDTGIENFDFNNDLPVRFAFSDPDPNDTLSAADVRWQISGGGWAETDNVTLVSEGLSRYLYVFPGGTVAIDGAIIEFQVRAYDQLGAQGEWSDSVFWTARDTPTTATISAPLAGDTIDSHDPVLSWSTVAGVFRYQLAVFDDTGTTALLAYTEVLGDGVTTDFDTDLPEQDGFAYVNAADLQLGVRWQQYSDVWSDWALTGVVTVDINPPLTPTLVLTVDLATASVLAEISNPGSDPFPPVHNDLYRTDVLTGDEVRIATGIAIDGSFTDWMPGFHRDYTYIAQAVTANGAFASST